MELSNFRMIALSGCIGKTYHLLLNDCLTTYLLCNKLIDPTMQKAFLPGINGCIEHNLVLDEVVKDAKNRKRTVHITFFDLADAFGSVPHNSIIHSLRRNYFPPEVIQYVHNFYKKPMNSKWVLPHLSAMDPTSKRQILANDLVRRMSRIDPSQLDKLAVPVINRYNHKLIYSGYPHDERMRIVESGISIYHDKLDTALEEGREFSEWERTLFR